MMTAIAPDRVDTAPPPADPPTGPPADTGGPDDGVHAYTLNFSATTSAARDRLMDLLPGRTLDVLVNHALQVYAELEDLDRRDGRLYTREAGSDILLRLRFL